MPSEPVILEAAVQWLKEAADVARHSGLHRIEADAGSRLSPVLTDSGDFELAASYARLSVGAAEQAGDVYHLPQKLAALADIEASRGDLAAAETAYSKATGIVNSLFTDLPNPRHENTVVATMSSVFLGHFDLALNRFHDPGRAFEILESARARGLVDRIRERPSVRESGDPRMLYRVADLNRRLSGEQDSLGRSRLLDRLWEADCEHCVLPVQIWNCSLLPQRSRFRCINCSHDCATGSCLSICFGPLRVVRLRR
jgi:hypothetical protein